jgi:hypothetical protein
MKTQFDVNVLVKRSTSHISEGQRSTAFTQVVPKREVITHHILIADSI